VKFAVLAVLAIAGGVLGGGVFTIVLPPLALIALISAFGYSVLAPGAGLSASRSRSSSSPLSRSKQRESGHVPTSPERLADLRRARQ
jgi:hypothetical protein